MINIAKPHKRAKAKHVSRSDHVSVVCEICGKELIRSKAIRHHVDPTRKTKEPGSLAKADKREKNDLLFVCRKCHGKIHKKLQTPVTYVDNTGKRRLKRVYETDNTEASIWGQ